MANDRDLKKLNADQRRKQLDVQKRTGKIKDNNRWDDFKHRRAKQINLYIEAKAIQIKATWYISLITKVLYFKYFADKYHKVKIQRMKDL